MNLQQSAPRYYLPPIEPAPTAPRPAIEAEPREHQRRPTMEQRAEWAVSMSLENWDMLPPEAQMQDFMLRMFFMKSLGDAPIDIRVLLFAHTCKLALTFGNSDFLQAWRMLVDAYQQESPAVRELLKTVMDRVHLKTELYGDGGVQWERSSPIW